MIQAVNFTKDNNTIALIVGAAFGALYGKSAFRNEWITGLSVRLQIDGKDSEIFELLECVESYFKA